MDEPYNALYQTDFDEASVRLNALGTKTGATGMAGELQKYTIFWRPSVFVPVFLPLKFAFWWPTLTRKRYATANFFIVSQHRLLSIFKHRDINIILIQLELFIYTQTDTRSSLKNAQKDECSPRISAYCACPRPTIWKKRVPGVRNEEKTAV